MKLKIPVSFLFTICILLFLPNFKTQTFAGAENRPEDIQILSSNDRAVTIEFRVSDWSFERIVINGEELTRIDFEGANLNDQPGKPQIPYHVAVVGIPFGAQVRYEILESDYEVQNDIKLLPYPQIKKIDYLPESEFILDKAIYDRSQKFPFELVQIDAPAFLREQEIVRMQVAGVQYLPTQGQILKYSRIVLRLEFIGGKIVTKPRTFLQSNAEEILYKNALLNYSQARNWRHLKDDRQMLRKGRSLFQNRTFYKFSIQEEGIYKIDGAFLESKNINLNQIEPAKIRLFNNGGRELPRDSNAPRPNGMIENAIVVEDGGDGRFDANDYILFYGNGVNGWEYNSAARSYSHYINHYGFDNVYWLTFDSQQDGKRMTKVSSGAASADIHEQYQGLAFIEEELDNPLRSGLNFFGRQFSISESGQSQSYHLDLPNAIPSNFEQLKFRLASKNSGLHKFAISVNNNFVENVQFFGANSDLGQYLVIKAFDFSIATANQVIPGSNTIQLNYSHSSSTGQALLDWIELFYSAHLSAVEDELAFNVLPDSGVQAYRISNFSNSPVQLFDITDFSDVKQIVNGSFSDGSLTFTDFQQPTLPKRYLALNPSKYKSIENLERIEITDLRTPGRGAEFIIISHDDFSSEAQRLESLRENGNPDNRLQTEVVRISDIYNNFSGGLLDPVAIRDFIKYAYENWSPSPAYVLLLGDGDYDYKNIISKGDKNWIPTFETDELPASMRLRELESRTTDSWYTYVSGDDQVMDLAIGRINAQSLTDAKNAVDKIIAYETQPLRGNWRNTITMVGDDELVRGGNPSAQDVVHITQTENIAEKSIPKRFDVEKIYLTEFPKVLSASVSGVRKPLAQEALIRQINKGTLIVNFIGHGNSTQWAHEVVFEQSDNDRVQNTDKFIFFVAATCDWALFDNPQRQSQAEELLLAQNRGAIAILSSTRLVFSTSNFRFNQFFYNNLFNTTGETQRIGDAFILSRLLTGNITNDEKFHIYGDPTLRLAVPKLEAVITSMSPDSIVALSTIEVTGEVKNDGQLASEFNGKALITTFDSKKFVQNIPEAGSPQLYHLPGNSIYRGTVPVQNGKFTARFIVPKDISYGGNLARISAYVWNDETDGAGYRENIVVSSKSSNLVDSKGPEMKIYFRDYENFTSGDIVNENVTLVVELTDTISGINIAGEIGHRMTLTIDPDEETCISEFNRFRGISNIDLTDLFQFKEGDHLSGTVEFPLQFPREVDVGGRTVPCINANGEDRHTLLVKAWDNSNNSSTALVEVLVVHEQGLVVQDIMNYPNPFTQNTTFTFISNRDAEVQIKIYTISGQLIRTLPRPREYNFTKSGFNMIEWDGRDADGDIPANGVYLYKLIARSQGESGMIHKEEIGRLAILR